MEATGLTGRHSCLSADHQIGRPGGTAGVHRPGIPGPLHRKAGMRDSACIMTANKTAPPTFETAGYGICGGRSPVSLPLSA